MTSTRVPHKRVVNPSTLRDVKRTRSPSFWTAAGSVPGSYFVLSSATMPKKPPSRSWERTVPVVWIRFGSPPPGFADWCVVEHETRRTETRSGAILRMRRPPCSGDQFEALDLDQRADHVVRDQVRPRLGDEAHALALDPRFLREVDRVVELAIVGVDGVEAAFERLVVDGPVGDDHLRPARGNRAADGEDGNQDEEEQIR